MSNNKSKYICSLCNFHSGLKGDYTRHIRTKKHKTLTQENKLISGDDDSNLKNKLHQQKEAELLVFAKILDEREKKLKVKEQHIENILRETRVTNMETEMKKMMWQIETLTNIIQLQENADKYPTN
jgi:hypothetical protein|tara:strand:- start:67 stop:444 length:378 start_codon:yes stop_codon:yes gene_type:complete